MEVPNAIANFNTIPQIPFCQSTVACAMTHVWPEIHLCHRPPGTPGDGNPWSTAGVVATTQGLCA